MVRFGIDISHWQGNYDFLRAWNEGAEFAIVKGGGADDGLYTDSKFERNYDHAKSLLMPVGVYWFSCATTKEEAEREAEFFRTHCLAGKRYELPVYIDVEARPMTALDKKTLTDVVCAWCDYLEKRGYWVGIYASYSCFMNKMEDKRLERYAHWVAQWSSTCSYRKPCLGMWQFGGETNLMRGNKVAGVVTDQNYMLVDYPTMIKEAKCNGFDTEKRTYTDVAKDIIDGKYGNGNARKDKLLSEGYTLDEIVKIQNIVNGLIGIYK